MVYIVGAGPGGSGLITLRGMECIENAEVIVYDHLVNPTFLNYASENCMLIYAGKTAGSHQMEQEKINETLIKYGKTLNVVRLKGGDPFVFGRGGEEAAVLAENDIPYELVAGVSSCYSVPMYSGIPVTSRGTASSFHVVTGHEKNGNQTVDYSMLAKLGGTLVFLMGLGNAGKISSELIENGMDANTGAAVISRGTTQKHHHVVGTLGELSSMAEKVSAPAVIIVGNTVRGQREWFSPEGKNILVTGTRLMNFELQKAFGGNLTEISLIKTVPINYDAFTGTDLKSFSHIVFTSANGVNIFFEYLKKAKIDVRILSNSAFAAVGNKTALALEERGFYVDIIPDISNGRELANILCAERHTKMLIIRAENGNSEMTDILSENGVCFTDLKLYRTETDYSKKELLNLCVKDMDYVIIASGSAAKAFAEMTVGDTDARIISIGAGTTAEAGKYGVKVYKTAETACAASIAECIRSDFE